MALNFTGEAEAVIVGPAVDLSRQRNGDMVLTAAVRLDAPASGPIELGFGKDRINIHPLLQDAKVGEWRTIRVRLACFDATAIGVTAVETPFVLASKVSLRLSLADIGLAPHDTAAACPAN